MYLPMLLWVQRLTIDYRCCQNYSVRNCFVILGYSQIINNYKMPHECLFDHESRGYVCINNIIFIYKQYIFKERYYATRQQSCVIHHGGGILIMEHILCWIIFA